MFPVDGAVCVRDTNQGIAVFVQDVRGAIAIQVGYHHVIPNAGAFSG